MSPESSQLTVLALDSATEACSVALYRNGDVHEDFTVIERGHAEHLLPMIDSLLKKSGIRLVDVDLFAFGAGPGSFTGLRIGVAMIQGLAMSVDRPVTPVSSLAALAARRTGDVLAMIDARMGQVYHGLFSVGKQGQPVPVGEEVVSNPADVPVPEVERLNILGSGWDSYADALHDRFDTGLQLEFVAGEYPHAADVARIAAHELNRGRAVEPGQALPHYVRNNVARKMGE